MKANVYYETNLQAKLLNNIANTMILNPSICCDLYESESSTIRVPFAFLFTCSNDYTCQHF